MDYIPFHDEPDPGWLSAVLREAGILPYGEVTRIESASTGAFNSKTEYLRVSYSADARLSAPRRLVLKQNTSQDWSIAAGIDEVSFYQLVRKLGSHPEVIPPCYAAAHEPASGKSYILLQDLSETHAPPITRDEQISIIQGVPQPAYQEAVIDTLAQLHAYWWDHPLRKAGPFEVGYWSRDKERFVQYLAKRQASWKGLMARREVTEGAWFPGQLINFYEQLFTYLPQFWEKYLAPRFRAEKHLTLIHGDTYFCNFLCPRIPGAGPTYLLDWQSPSFDICAYDLVNLLAAFWTRAQRQDGNREKHLLRRYHQALQKYGVSDYSWEDLTADYQAGIIFWILMPVQDGYDGASKDYWWPKMRCLLQAFTDWDCAEYLGASFPALEGDEYAD
jgi:thiamine kinase-like enzyme